jgi:hypothetical protein
MNKKVFNYLRMHGMEYFKTLPFFRDSFTVAVEGTVVLRNLRNHSPNDTGPRL